MTAPAIGKTSSRCNNLLMLASLVIAIVAALAAVGGPSAAAQPLCLDGKVWSAEQQACVAMAEVQPVEELPLEESQPTEIPAPTQAIVPTDIPADDEAAQPADTPAPTEASDTTETPEGDSGLRSGGLSYLNMMQWDCLAGFDPRTADQTTLNENCSTNIAEVVYSLTVDGKVFGSATSPMMPASFSNVPPGDFAVSQSVPPGYTGPTLVLCRQDYAPITSDRRMIFPDGIDGGSFVLQDVQPDTVWWCHSYLAPLTTGSITAYVFDCPENYNMYVAEPEDLKANCDPYLENIQFELEYSDLVSASSTNTLGRTTYANVPPGTYRLRERMPDNYGVPLVFCTVRGPSGQTLENYDRYDVSNTASIGLGMDALEHVACDFFMAPNGQALEDPGFPPQGLVPGDAATPANEAAIPDDMPELGELPVAEAGIQEPGIPAAIDPGIANQEIAPGTTILTIHNVACPEDFNRIDPDRGSCGPALADIPFVVTVNNELIDAATTDAGGFVFFRDVPAGDIAVKATMPPEYGAPVVSCTIYTLATGQIMRGRDSALHEASIDGSVVIPDVRPGEGANCGWYNVPTDASGEIMIYVNGCPENYDIYGKSPEELNADCTGQFEGTEIVLEHPTEGNSSAFATGLSLASFTNIAPGQVRLREVMPTGYGVPVVFCQVSGPDGQTTEQYDKYNVSNNASIGLGMDELESVGCDFFQAPGGQPVDAETSSGNEGFPPQGLASEGNATPADAAGGPSNPDLDVENVAPQEVEVPDDTPGAVAILAYEYPASFNAYNATANEINLTCPYVEQTVFEFSLIDGNGALAIQHTALKEPYLDFNEVAPGTITVKASAPEGFREPVVYCQATGAPGETPGPYDRMSLTAVATVTYALEGGERLGCDWFNVPAGSPFDAVQPVEVEDLAPVDAIDNDSGEDAPPATPQAIPPG